MIEGALITVWLIAYTTIIFGCLIGLLIFTVIRRK